MPSAQTCQSQDKFECDGEELFYSYLEWSDVECGVCGGDSVTGERLKKNLDVWNEMGASKFVMDVIQRGYYLPFNRIPKVKFMRNHKSCEHHSEFVKQSVMELVRSGAGKPISQSEVAFCSPLGVVEGRKLRLILDLRGVNECLTLKKFKLDDIRMATQIYQKNDYVVCFDLKSGYHRINIAEEHHKYLCFSWEGKFFSFTVLPFGLSSAPYIFTKVVRVLVKFWRASGVRCMMYFDDGSAAGDSYEEALAIGKFLEYTLVRAGFVINYKKSHFTPTQFPVMLGFQLNLCDGICFVTQERIDKFKSHLSVIANFP